MCEKQTKKDVGEVAASSTQHTYTTQNNPLYDFLLQHIVEKGNDFTHTSLGNPVGSFYIPSDERATFKELYKKAFKAGCHLCLTEKHRHISPVLIDLDFRQTTNERIYTHEHVEQFVTIIQNYIFEYVNLDVATAYILEKPAPRSNKSGDFKDGIHIVFPDVVTHEAIQYKIRERFINEHPTLWTRLGFTNSANDIYDEAVIKKNNWFMYGSRKSDEQYPWVVTYILNGTSKMVIDPKFDHLIDILSIHQYKESRYTTQGTHIINDYEQKCIEDALQTNYETSSQLYDDENDDAFDVDEVGQLVKLLSTDRADRYMDWMRVGWCLNNIDKSLCNLWVDFSKRSSKFIEGECEKMWSRMTNYSSNKLRIGSLYMWAKEDNPEGYKQLCGDDVTRAIIRAAKSGYDADACYILYILYKDMFVCTEGDVWYMFKSHIWCRQKTADCIYSKMSGDVYNEVMRLHKFYTEKAKKAKTKEEEHKNMATRLRTLAGNFKTVNFKTKMLSDARSLFRDPTFEEKLDSNPDVVAFTNGVLDLTTKVLRPGHPSDFISKNCGYDYIPLDKIHKDDIDWVETFFRKVFPREDVRLFKLHCFSRCLQGVQESESINIETGSGGNSKTQVFKFLSKAFGDYCVSIPSSMITKDHEYNRGDPFLLTIKNSRIIFASEAKRGASFNDGFLKELTGGEALKARFNHGNDVNTIKPTFSFFFMCNDVPNFPGDDGGIARRLRVTRYESKFVDGVKDDYDNNIFSRCSQNELEKDMMRCKQALMAVLVSKYDDQFKLTVPETIKRWSKVLLQENNPFDDFMEEKLERSSSDDYVTLKTLKELFERFARDKKVGTFKKSKIKEELVKILGDPIEQYWHNSTNICNAFIGWRLIDDNHCVLD